MHKGAVTLSPGGAIVLGLLMDERGPRSGYDLQREAAASVGHFWPVTKAHVYAELPRLEEQGFVKSRAVRQTGAPDKRLYEATVAGRGALAMWLADADLGEPKLRHPLLLKVFFAGDMDREALLDAIEAHRTKTAAALARYRTLVDQPSGPDPARERWRKLVVRHGINRVEADLKWLDELKRLCKTEYSDS